MSSYFETKYFDAYLYYNSRNSRNGGVPQIAAIELSAYSTIINWANLPLRPLLYKDRRSRRLPVMHLVISGDEGKLLYYIYRAAQFITNLSKTNPNESQLKYFNDCTGLESELEWLPMELLEGMVRLLKWGSGVNIYGRKKGVIKSDFLKVLALISGEDVFTSQERQAIVILAKELGMNKKDWIAFNSSVINSTDSSFYSSREKFTVFKDFKINKEKLYSLIDLLNPALGHWVRIKEEYLVLEKGKWMPLISREDHVKFFMDPEIRISLLENRTIIERQYEELIRLDSLLHFNLDIKALDLQNKISEGKHIVITNKLVAYERVLAINLKLVYEEVKIVTQFLCQINALKSLISSEPLARRLTISLPLRNDLKALNEKLKKIYAHHRKAMEDVICILQKLLIILGEQHQETTRFNINMESNLKELEFWTSRMGLFEKK